MESLASPPKQIIELLCHLVEQATEHAFILLDPKGQVLWCSPGAESIFAIRSSDAEGRDFSEIFTDRDRAAGIAELEMAIAESAAISEDDRWHLRFDGSTFWSSGALIPLRDPLSRKLLGFGKIVRDRTDVKTQMELLAHRIDALQAADRHRDRAMTTLAHELRNVFSGLRGAVDLLDRPLDDESRREKFVGLMRRQLALVERLIDDLLDVKRSATGRITLAPMRVSLESEIAAVVEQLRSKIELHRVRVEMFAPSVPVVVEADRQRLQQVFANLLDNAIKYTPSGGRIWIKITTEDKDAVVHIEDTGRGIPHDMLRSIFDLFAQVSPQDAGGGLGVGLALVRELVVLHGGAVQAISKGLGEGSEFSVRLPLAPLSGPAQN